MRTILITDDDKLFRWALRQSLEEAGFRVLEADRVSSARARMLSEDVDCAVFDHDLPDGSGFDLLDGEAREKPCCPVIFLTAHPTDEGRARARQLGAFAYLSKLDDFDKVVEVVLAALRAVAGEPRA